MSAPSPLRIRRPSWCRATAVLLLAAGVLLALVALERANPDPAPEGRRELTSAALSPLSMVDGAVRRRDPLPSAPWPVLAVLIALAGLALTGRSVRPVPVLIPIPSRADQPQGAGYYRGPPRRPTR